jgi:hypothetical protein
MVVLDPQSSAEVSQCQRRLRDLVGDPKLILGVVRGSTNDALAKKFDEQSQTQPSRTAVWVKDVRCFDPGQESTWFGDDPTDVGCALTFARKPSVRLHADAMTFDVEDAYAQAEQGD